MAMDGALLHSGQPPETHCDGSGELTWTSVDGLDLISSFLSFVCPIERFLFDRLAIVAGSYCLLSFVFHGYGWDDAKGRVPRLGMNMKHRMNSDDGVESWGFVFIGIWFLRNTIVIFCLVRP